MQGWTLSASRSGILLEHLWTYWIPKLWVLLHIQWKTGQRGVYVVSSSALKVVSISIRRHNGKSKSSRTAEHTYSHAQHHHHKLNLYPSTNTIGTVYVRSYLPLASKPQPQEEVGVMPPRGSAETRPRDRAMWSGLGCSRVRRWL
jgi:hypothetical protein